MNAELEEIELAYPKAKADVGAVRAKLVDACRRQDDLARQLFPSMHPGAASGGYPQVGGLFPANDSRMFAIRHEVAELQTAFRAAQDRVQRLTFAREQLHMWIHGARLRAAQIQREAESRRLLLQG